MLQVCYSIHISYRATSFPRAAAAATGTDVAFTSESVANELVQNKVLGKLIDCFTLVSYEQFDGSRRRTRRCRP